MPFFSKYLKGPVHGIFSSDELETGNMGPDDQGLEKNTGPTLDINTGVCNMDMGNLFHWSKQLQPCPDGQGFISSVTTKGASGSGRPGSNGVVVGMIRMDSTSCQGGRYI
jgi:hypothetical protein